MRMIKMARVVSFVAVIVAALLQLGFAGEAAAEKKAFIVGNSKYAHVTGLANPANDAQDLATRLKALGFATPNVGLLTAAGLLPPAPDAIPFIR